jgi:predicted CopG family antitoxin
VDANSLINSYFSLRGGFPIPRPRKYADTVVKSFSIEREVYTRLRAMLASQDKSISEEVNALLRKRLAELEGVAPSAKGNEDYEALKGQHLKLVEEVKRLTKPLEKDGVYESLMRFAHALGLDLTDLHNVEDIATKILKNWREHLNQDAQPSHIHLFITLLEKGKQKKDIERKLTEIRLRAAPTSTENAHH